MSDHYSPHILYTRFHNIGQYSRMLMYMYVLHSPEKRLSSPPYALIYLGTKILLKGLLLSTL